MMRRDDDEAVRHIEHGLEIVAREQGIERSGGSLCMPGWSSTAAHGVMPALVSSFYRLAIAVYFCGRPETLLQERIMTATQPRMPSGTVASFDGIDRARKDLALLVGSTLKFVAHVSKHRYCGTATAPLFRRRDERIQSLTSWHASFKLLATAATLTDAADSNSARRRLECLVLESQLLALIILLHTCLDANESGYDARTEEFRSMLLLCEEYISLSASSANTEPRRGAVDFTFDMEILPQLFLVGKKCRLRPYRRWGIALLKKYTRREGMWDPKRLYRLATRIMEIEEAQSFPGDESPPRECNRLWTVDADWRDSGSLLATFAYKPVVLGGNGLSWKETILVEPSQ